MKHTLFLTCVAPIFLGWVVSGCSFFSQGVVYRSPTLTKDLTGPKKPTHKTVEVIDGEKKILIDAPPEGYIVKRIVILQAINRSGNDVPGLEEFYARKLLEDLAQTHFYNVQSLKDLNLQPEDYLSQNTPDIKKIIRLGKTHDVWGVFLPVIDEVEIQNEGGEVGLVRKQDLIARVTASVQVFDVQARKKIFDRKISQQSTESITNFALLNSTRPQNFTPRAYKAVQEIAFDFMPELTQLTAKIGWKASIASIELDRIFINAGRKSGLRLGDILQVSEPGADIVDAESERVLGQAPGRVKGTLEIINYFGDDGAIGRLQSGADFMSGDTVELY